MRHILREREPDRPSVRLGHLTLAELSTTGQQRHVEPGNLRSELRGDLDWIVMKALEKDRNRRYKTAHGLARDFERYLANELATARPPSVLYRFGKLVRRNSLVFMAIAAAGLALLLGLCLSSWLYLREREARQIASATEQKQIHLRKEADHLRHEAEVRQQLTQATLLSSQDRIAEADALITGITEPNSNLEHADLFRRLGSWHVANDRWKQAAARLVVLTRIEQPEKWDSASLDYLRCGSGLLEANDKAEYEQFRESIIARCVGTANPVVAERVIKASLLLPADGPILRQLEFLAQVAEKRNRLNVAKLSLSERIKSAWGLFSLALLEYRRGNPAEALRLCERSSAFNIPSPSIDANSLALEGLAHRALNQPAEASAAFGRCRQLIAAEQNYQKIDYWFDWAFPRLLLKEAGEMD